MKDFVCPNTSSPAWKRLLKELGSKFEAYRAWIANNFEIPDIKETPTISREKGFRVIERNNLDLIRNYKKQIGLNRSKIRETTDKNIKDSLGKENIYFYEEIEKLKEQNKQVKLISNRAEIVNVAREQLDEIDKILSNPKIDLKNVNRHITTLNMWKRISDLSDMNNHPIFSEKLFEKMLQDKNFLSAIKTINGRSELLLNKVAQIGEKLIEKQIVNSHFEDNIKEEVLKQFKKMMREGVKDVNTIASLMLDISEYDNVLFKIMTEWTRKADFDAHLEYTELFEKINSFLSSLTTEDKDLFKQTQSNTDKRETGNFTFRFTQSFFTRIGQVKTRFRNAEKSASNKKKEEKDKAMSKAYKDMLDEYRKFSHAIDINVLFGKEGVKKQEYIKYLKDRLGEKSYNFYYKEAEKRIKEFEEDLILQSNYYKDINPKFAEYKTKIWKINNDPRNVASWINNGFKEDGKVAPSFRYTLMIPKDNEYYDNKYKQIEANDNLLEIHNFIIETFQRLTSYLPPDKTGLDQTNSLPEISRSIIETWMNDGTLKTLSSVMDKLRDSIRTPDITSTIDSVDLEITGKQRKNFQIPVKNNKEEISDYIGIKKREYFLSRTAWIKQAKDSAERFKRKEQVTEEISALIPEWKADKQSELSKRKSWDLEKVMRAYGAMAITYKHRAKVEDSMRMIDNIMSKVKELSINPTGEAVKTSQGDLLKKTGLVNMMKSWDYYQDIFYGYPSRKPEGQVSKKVLTSDEKKLAEDYKKLIKDMDDAHDRGEITQEEWIKELSLLYSKLDDLGEYKTWSAIGDDMLAYLQIKAMGWNVFSAFSNLGFGYISNLIEASDGRRFNMKEFWKASGLLLHSVGRSASFGMFETDMSKKIHAIWERLDVGTKSIYETTMDSNKAKMKSALDGVAPLNMQERTEFINQATVMVAQLLHKKVTVDGKEISLFDAYDNDGNLPENLRDVEVSMVSSIAETIRDNHGNYDNLHNPILLKKHFLGRAFIQFKTWAIMGFYNRFSGDSYSVNIGAKRGRYRSYVNFYRELGPIKGTFEVTLQLLRKLMFQSTTFDNMPFDEVDAANMRKNLTEIVLLMSVTGLGLLLKNFAFDDDDEVSDLKFATVFLLNQMNRMQTDILFYTNPIEFQKLNRQALPLFSLVTDASKLTMHMLNLIQGGSDLYETGIYAGQSKSWRYSKGLIPGLVTLNRLEAVTKQKVW